MRAKPAGRAKKVIAPFRRDNMSHKNSFAAGTSDATRPGRATKTMGEGRSSNMAIKNGFCCNE